MLRGAWQRVASHGGVRQGGVSPACGTRVATVVSRGGRRRLTQQSGPQKGTAGGPPLGAKALAAGATAGFTGSLMGMGGGFIALPLLTGWLRLTQHQAHGTSLGGVCATGAAGAYGFASAGQVDWAALPPMVVAAMVMSPLGAKATGYISQAVLKRALGVFMIGVAPLLIFRKELLALRDGVDDGSDDDSAAPRKRLEVKVTAVTGDGTTTVAASAAASTASTSPDPWRMAAIGACSGLLSGVFGVGGGVVIVPALALSTDLSHKEMLGLSLASMVLPSIAGGIVHYRAANLLPRVAVPLAAGTAVGAYLGSSYVVQHVDNEVLKWAFAAFMTGLGVKTLRAAGAPALLRRAAAAGGGGGGGGAATAEAAAVARATEAGRAAGAAAARAAARQ